MLMNIKAVISLIKQKKVNDFWLSAYKNESGVMLRDSLEK